MPTDHLAPTRLLLELAPRGSDYAKEPFPFYLQRVSQLLPNFPGCVLGQWLHRHYSCVSGDYGWLGFPSLSFCQAIWSTERILSEVSTWADDLVDNHSSFFDEQVNAPGSLAEEMRRIGTWPVPIMVIRNESGLATPNGFPMAAPLHLLEGHHRLGYLRRMSQLGIAGPQHSLWLVDVDPGAVLDYWPMNDVYVRAITEDAPAGQ